jgi:hypothetical protein
MKRTLLLLVPLVAACAAQTQVKYDLPAAYVSPGTTIEIPKPRGDAYRAVLDQLKRRSAEILEADETAGEIVFRASPKRPADYVDCGVLSYDAQSFPVAEDQRRFSYVPQAAEGRQFQHFVDAKSLGSSTFWALAGAWASAPSIQFTQSVQLDAAVLIKFRPIDAAATEASVVAGYSVTRSLTGVTSDGRRSGPVDDRVTFVTGQTAELQDGPCCRGTYKLEQDALAFVSAACSVAE